MANPNNRNEENNEEQWLEQFCQIGMIGDGTFGLVNLAAIVSPFPDRGKLVAVKKVSGNTGAFSAAMGEIELLQKISHENVVKLIDVYVDTLASVAYLALDFAEHDLRQIIGHHIALDGRPPLSPYTVKSLIWQLLNGLNYLHENRVMHRDLKPSNVLVMGKGEEHGVVKIKDFELVRTYESPLQPLCADGVVETLWYRAPELLLGAKHYTSAIDMWAVGCIFAELITLKPLFRGRPQEATKNPFERDQLDKIFQVLGHPTLEKWPTLANLPYWEQDREHIQSLKYHPVGLYQTVDLPRESPASDLLRKMLEYDPAKRITAAQALNHEYFRGEPLAGRNSLVPSTGDRFKYPNRSILPLPEPPVSCPNLWHF